MNKDLEGYKFRFVYPLTDTSHVPAKLITTLHINVHVEVNRKDTIGKISILSITSFEATTFIANDIRNIIKLLREDVYEDITEACRTLHL